MSSSSDSSVNIGNGNVSIKKIVMTKEEHRSQSLKAMNGASFNGAAFNGVSNGSHQNGTSTNGLHLPINQNGPSENEFRRKDNDTFEGMDFLKEAVELIMKEAVTEGVNVNNKVVEFVHPKELEKKLALGLRSQPAGKEKLLHVLRDVIKYSVRTGHPHFFNQLYGGLDAYALSGAWLTDAVNTSQYTYEVAPVFTLMEKALFTEMLRLIGFPDGDAIFCPGGSISNIYGMSLARYRMFPDVKRTGLSGLPKLCILTSEKGHYSLKKGAALLGIGMDNVFGVKTDSASRMIPEELDKTLVRVKSEGYTPFLVNATAGTTVIGAYDPLDSIADVCQKHSVWMHVDAAWGGGVLLSKKLRVKMAGVERADSVTWNPHKMMGAPLQASVFFTRHKTMLAECHSAKAKYLFQQDKFYDVSYDTGDKSVQCGRKVDVLKVWLMWRAKGSAQFERDIEHLFDCAHYLTKKITMTKGFRLVVKEPECTNVCFWYIPPSLRGKEENEEWWEKLSKVAPLIKQRMVMEGTMLIGYQPDGDLVNFFRMVISNLKVTLADMDFLVAEIDRLGRDL